MEAFLLLFYRLLGVVFVRPFGRHDVVDLSFWSGSAEVRQVERRDGKLRQAFESGAPKTSHVAQAPRQRWHLSFGHHRNTAQLSACAGICRPISRHVTCPSPARRPRSVWSGAELYQLAIRESLVTPWSRIAPEQRVIRLNPVRLLSAPPAGSSTTFRLKTGKDGRTMKCPLEPAHS